MKYQTQPALPASQLYPSHHPPKPQVAYVHAFITAHCRPHSSSLVILCTFDAGLVPSGHFSGHFLLVPHCPGNHSSVRHWEGENWIRIEPDS